ncbi:hypothetical protein HNQ68_001598 [Pseudochrobactrum saccharolyticum]|uniref:Stress-response A/B barrel domain-containing protein n=1 Tax=Pseudochrobactrum saccharolyticum TaxID=354352 RepID=A0A7W8AJM7_9HYPH|nr:Dabb family protein [Pseudochrobactrum saccharolyticum]KAB0538939.1 Dabb family protein [Pseudochrobactrum saccharolyticum]MBB5091074.1 hypothetical protein [Pseudochrobactrum saccharolyticum]
MHQFIKATALLLFLTPSAQAQSIWHGNHIPVTFQQDEKPEIFTAPDYKPGVIRHIVLFRYRPDVSDAQRMAVLLRFRNMKHTAKRNGEPYIVSIHAGRQNSFENLGQGFDQAFIVKFRSEGDRNYYVGTPAVIDPAFYDPEHQKFKEFVAPLLADRGSLVFDFVSDK